MNAAWRQTIDRLAELDASFRERTVRERALLVACAAALVFVSLDQLAIQPVERDRRQARATVVGLETEIGAREAELQALEHSTLSPEQQRQADEIEQLTRQLAQIEARLERHVAALVPPEAIVSVLEEVLAEDPSLALVRLESRSPERLGARVDGEATTPQPSRRLYRHGLRLELEGSYPATVDYLERLEASRWNLLWDRVVYEVQQYPTGRTTIDLHTISDQEEWIGV